MNDFGAALALRKVAEGEISPATEIAKWLAEQEGIAGLYALDDLVAEVMSVAHQAVDEESSGRAIETVVSDLSSRPSTRLFAAFDGARAAQVIECGPVTLGPAPLINERYGLKSCVEPAAAAIFDQGDSLAIVVEVPARGRLGAAHATRWLRGGLGSLYLLAREHGLKPALGTVSEDIPAASVFVGPATGSAFERISHQFRLAAGEPLDVDALLGRDDALAFLADCLSPQPSDLVAERLTQCAHWFQAGADALAYPDAVLALGIALEALVGGEGKGNVVEVVSKRCGYLLRKGENDQERALSGLDWKRRATKYYGERSDVAHGRYAEDPGRLTLQPSVREEFEQLVARLVFRFRDRGRAEKWSDYKSMKRWWELLEMV